MAKKKTTELVRAFAEEHRTLMRGLSAILGKVKAEEFSDARKLADELDRDAGPHIQFEEEVLYPEIGGEFEQQLRSEHATVRDAIKRLLEVNLSEADLPKLRKELLEAFEVAVEHAESCGTLISRLNTLPETAQQEAMSRLGELRERGKRWTELS